MMIDIKPEVIDDLREILLVLEDAAISHKNCSDTEALIEAWRPSDEEKDIVCPDLTVGLIRKAARIRKLLKL